MMTLSLHPSKFRIVLLTLVDIGALQGTTEFRLMDSTAQPTNIYLIMGPNGAGKTTVLESIYTSMRLLDAREHPSYGMEALDGDAEGGIQLDALVVLDDGTRSKLYLISIVAGKPGLLKRWTAEDLEAVSAEKQLILAYRPRGRDRQIELSSESDEEAVAFAEAILSRTGEPSPALFDAGNGYPTVLYFPSDRGIRRPPERVRAVTQPQGLEYSVTHRFDTDGLAWASSIENLFVWFAWLGDGREKLCRDLVNELIFRRTKRLAEVDRVSLSVPVEVDGGFHRLDQLSSGERQLVQLVVRVASHATGSTIVLIDETEQHLHMVMRRRLITMIKDWAREHEGMSFVLTSHQTDSVRILAPKQKEAGLIKGGSLVKPKFKLPQ